MHEKSDIKKIINSVCYNDIKIEKNIDEKKWNSKYNVFNLFFLGILS